MKQLILCLAMLCPFWATTQPLLQVGDTLPGHLYEYITKQANLQTQLPAKKYLILDFWATWCPGCIKETPEMNKQAIENAAQLQVVLVTKESKEKVTDFRKPRKYLQDLALSFLYSDTILYKVFPHKYLPHQVWIAPSGRVEAITGPGLVTPEILSAWFAGNLPKLRTKSDPEIYKPKFPLFEGPNIELQQYRLYQSTAAGRLPDRGASSGFYHEENHTRYYYINMVPIYIIAELLKRPASYFVLEGKGAKNLVLYEKNTQEYLDSLQFTYELRVPRNTPKEQVNALILSDLQRYRHLTVNIERRKVDCYLLQISAPERLSNLLEFKIEANTYLPDEWYPLMNKPFGSLVSLLNNNKPTGRAFPPIIDETGLTQNINIYFPYEALKTIEQTNEVLQRYGLVLNAAVRELDMVVITYHPPESPFGALLPAGK